MSDDVEHNFGRDSEHNLVRDSEHNLVRDSEHNLVRDSEQITKTPIQENAKKEKDPKKVAAGKKLAEHNRRAKEALKREMQREAEKAQEEEETGKTEPWFPEMSFTTVVSLVGIGLTAINMFMSYRTPKVMSEPPQVRHPEPPASKIPVPITPKIGMI